jgi:hypothetical protein
MKSHGSESNRPSITVSIRSWLVGGRSAAQHDIMGSAGQCDSSQGGPLDIMAGSDQTELSPMPHLMSSPGTWDASDGAPQDIMAGRDRAELSPMPYLMSSPGTWDPSLGGPQDVMGGHRHA